MLSLSLSLALFLAALPLVSAYELRYYSDPNCKQEVSVGAPSNLPQFRYQYNRVGNPFVYNITNGPGSWIATDDPGYSHIAELVCRLSFKKCGIWATFPGQAETTGVWFDKYVLDVGRTRSMYANKWVQTLAAKEGCKALGSRAGMHVKWVVPWSSEDYPHCKAEYDPTGPIQGCAIDGAVVTSRAPIMPGEVTSTEPNSGTPKPLLIVLAIVAVCVLVAVAVFSVKMCTGKENEADAEDYEGDLE